MGSCIGSGSVRTSKAAYKGMRMCMYSEPVVRENSRMFHRAALGAYLMYAHVVKAGLHHQI